MRFRGARGLLVVMIGLAACRAPARPDAVVREVVPPTTAPSAARDAAPVDVGAGADPRHPPAGSFLVADAVVPSVELFAAGGVPAGRALSNPNRYGLPLVFRVMADRGEWLDVQVPTRPNGGRAFIRASDVSFRSVRNWIQVDVSDRSVRVLDGLTPVFETIGAVGRETSATPTGWFYVDGSVRLTDPTGSYGAGQLTLSGFSEVYTSFAGGDGQIALHGTNAPGLLGQAASNGCVRVANDAFLAIQRLAPTGTPVQIVP